MLKEKNVIARFAWFITEKLMLSGRQKVILDLSV